MCPTTIGFYPRKKVPQTLRSTSIFLNMMLTVNPTLTMFISNEIFVQTIGVIFCPAPSVRGTRNIRKRGNARTTSKWGKAWSRCKWDTWCEEVVGQTLVMDKRKRIVFLLVGNSSRCTWLNHSDINRALVATIKDKELYTEDSNQVGRPGFYWSYWAHRAPTL